MSVFDIRSQSVFFQVQKEILKKKKNLLIDFILCSSPRQWMNVHSAQAPESNEDCHLQEIVAMTFIFVTNI